MDHVKDELHSYITKHLKCQRKIKSELSHKSIINDCMFISFLGHEKLYDDVIDKVIDFYELFKCSVDSIVDVWKEKLGHIDKLHLIFDFRHKKLFGECIWHDKEVINVLKIYTSQNCTDEEYIEKLKELKAIEDEINENNLYDN